MTDVPTPESPEPQDPRKGPLSFLSGALTAGLLAWLALGLSRRMVVYFAVHPPHYSSPIAQNIAVTLKTLLVGLSFLATFSTGFVALGLTLVFLRSLFTARPLIARVWMTPHDLGQLALLLSPAILLSVLLLFTFAAGG